MTFEFILWIVLVAGGLCLALILIAVALSAAQSLGMLIEEPSPGALGTRSAVDQRVDALLRDVLEASEYHTLMTRGYVDVASSEHADFIYRIPRYGGMVTRYEHGRATIDLCVQPVDPLPGGDIVVLHKLLLQASELDYVATARKYPSRYYGDTYHP
ncbi:MAG TPA: hypothetical protein VIG30_10485 [Ktedonobacterales bacterium]